MVTQQRHGIGGPGKIDHPEAVGAAVDEIAQQDELVVFGQG